MTYTLPEIPPQWFHTAREIIMRDGHQVAAQGSYLVARARPTDQWLRLLCGMPPHCKGFASTQERDEALAILKGEAPLPPIPAEAHGH